MFVFKVFDDMRDESLQLYIHAAAFFVALKVIKVFAGFNWKELAFVSLVGLSIMI